MLSDGRRRAMGDRASQDDVLVVDKYILELKKDVTARLRFHALQHHEE